MKSLLARFSNLPVFFKKHWWKIAIVSILLKIAPIIIWWHRIEYWLINTWFWLKNIHPWWQLLIGLVFCAILFLGLMQTEIQMEREEEHK